MEYLEIKDALTILRRRRKFDVHYYGCDHGFLDAFSGFLRRFRIDGPFLVMQRSIPTAKFEDFEAFKISLWSGIPLVYFSLISDRYVSCNPDKTCLTTLYTAYVDGNNERIRLKSKIKLVESVKSIEGMAMREILVFNERISLLDFHKVLRKSVFPVELVDRVFDVSYWWEKVGVLGLYELLFLCVYLNKGILIENFEDGNLESESRFVESVVKYAWNKVVSMTGLTPLVVRLPWGKQSRYYPPVVEKVVDSFLMGR